MPAEVSQDLVVRVQVAYSLFNFGMEARLADLKSEYFVRKYAYILAKCLDARPLGLRVGAIYFPDAGAWHFLQDYRGVGGNDGDAISDSH
ncbi:hypothetical protein AMK30_02170 [Streptomyces sp. CB02460]|nr:hypothetical protein AMK30_02170 [Streptomyces sp. CB02460]